MPYALLLQTIACRMMLTIIFCFLENFRCWKLRCNINFFFPCYSRPWILKVSWKKEHRLLSFSQWLSKKRWTGHHHFHWASVAGPNGLLLSFCLTHTYKKHALFWFWLGVYFIYYYFCLLLLSCLVFLGYWTDKMSGLYYSFCTYGSFSSNHLCYFPWVWSTTNPYLFTMLWQIKEHENKLESERDIKGYLLLQQKVLPGPNFYILNGKLYPCISTKQVLIHDRLKNLKKN